MRQASTTSTWRTRTRLLSTLTARRSTTRSSFKQNTPAQFHLMHTSDHRMQRELTRHRRATGVVCIQSLRRGLVASSVKGVCGRLPDALNESGALVAMGRHCRRARAGRAQSNWGQLLVHSNESIRSWPQRTPGHGHGGWTLQPALLMSVRGIAVYSRRGSHRAGRCSGSDASLPHSGGSLALAGGAFGTLRSRSHAHIANGETCSVY